MQTTEEIQTHVTFNVYKKDGKLIETLKAQPFIERITFCEENLTSREILMPDGNKYKKRYEIDVLEALRKHGIISCIVSFQQHTHGNYAVIRKIKDSQNEY